MEDLSYSERVAWLRLYRTPMIGPASFNLLLARYGSAEAALAASPEWGDNKKTHDFIIPSAAEIEREWRALEKINGRFLWRAEKSYPQALAHISDAPPCLSVLGREEFLHKTLIAIVGAREASLAGKKIAASMASDLGAAGVCVISGFARGIDTAAHSGALQSGTVAVLAGGVDHIYPPENKNLYAEIINSGAIISEQPIGLRPTAQHFPRRNRIISGLAQIIVVVEAKLRSGSLITARMALEQGREVCAVPGSPQDQRASGANLLIKQGAALVENASDILAQLPAHLWPGKTPTCVKIFSSPDSEKENKFSQNKIWQALSGAPANIDQLVLETGMEVAKIQEILLELEFAGKIERLPGNNVCRV
jgi:DNA processing protein